MRSKKYLVTFGTTFILLGCTDERIIDLPLRDLSGTIVIEGNVTDKAGPYQVKITRSDKATTMLDPKPVANAIVVITDNHGQADVLKYDKGVYETTTLTTHYGDIYTLSVTIDGNIYKAVSKMPEYVEFTGLKQQDTYHGDYLQKNIIPIFTDPVEKGNYYLFKPLGIGSFSGVTLFSDYTGNGQTNGRPLNSFGFWKNDEIKVEMQCIDEAIYNYFKALYLTNPNTPSNPPSNISNGALGYFSAHTISTKEIIIQ